MVADNADVCPDCGMELDSAAPTPAAPAPAPAVPPPGSSEPSGHTVDFGFDAAPVTPAPAPAIDLSKNDPFDFGSPGGTVSLDPIAPTPSAPTPPPAPVVPVNSAKITLKRGGALTGESFTFGPGSIVGRFDPESGPVDVDLAPLPEASYVSRHHVEFRHDAGSGSWFVKDLGSRNGTFWRAGAQGAFSRLSGEQAVQSGDEIALGNARFEFQAL
jgi:hypothetical protein